MAGPPRPAEDALQEAFGRYCSGGRLGEEGFTLAHLAVLGFPPGEEAAEMFSRSPFVGYVEFCRIVDHSREHVATSLRWPGDGLTPAAHGFSPGVSLADSPRAAARRLLDHLFPGEEIPLSEFLEKLGQECEKHRVAFSPADLVAVFQLGAPTAGFAEPLGSGRSAGAAALLAAKEALLSRIYQ